MKPFDIFAAKSGGLHRVARKRRYPKESGAPGPSLLSFIFALILVGTLSFTPSAAGTEAGGTLKNEAGFAQIEPVEFYFHKDRSRLNLKSSKARMWYNFQPADEEPEKKPLFIFFNGGPGCATSSALLSFNTSSMTLDRKLNGGKRIGPNPVSWTRLGNLLYVDARDTGFSYNLMRNSQDTDARAREFDAQNFNCFIDGADFVRLLLRFLASHPSIRKNPVVIVGESYGGLRATVMLHMLLNYRDYANGKMIYQDEALVKEIQAHYNVVFPQWKNRIVPPQAAAKQFGRQILVQPLLSGNYQNKAAGMMFEKKGSVIFQIAKETGTRYVPCPPLDDTCNPIERAFSFVDLKARRDIYDYSKPRGWLTTVFAGAASSVQYTNTLSALAGTDVTSIDFLYASNRKNAYRVIGFESGESRDISRIPVADRIRIESMKRVCKSYETMAAGDMVNVFGPLQSWDGYFLQCNDDSFDAYFYNKAIERGYKIDEMVPLYGELFLKNVVYVKTFITNAAYDLVVFTPALPKALSFHKGILRSAVHDTRPRRNIARTGWIVLNYMPGVSPDMPRLKTRTIRFPSYSKSCHSVPLTQGREIFKDVSAWLTQDHEKHERYEKHERSESYEE